MKIKFQLKVLHKVYFDEEGQTHPQIPLVVSVFLHSDCNRPVISIVGFFLLFQVSWKPPLIQNGEILNYEIRMPDPRIVVTGNTSSTMSHLVTNLLPYTNYSVTVIACSGGDGFLGGCTESLPTSVTTPSAAPQSVSPLSVTPISESFIAISWQPPLRPNGPHLR